MIDKLQYNHGTKQLTDVINSLIDAVNELSIRKVEPEGSTDLVGDEKLIGRRGRPCKS